MADTWVRPAVVGRTMGLGLALAVAVSAALPALPARASAAPVLLPKESLYAPNHILVIGPEDYLNALPSLLLTHNYSTERLRRIDVSYMDQLPPGYPLPFTPDERKFIRVDVLRIQSGHSVIDVLNFINDQQELPRLIATPDYVMANPWTVGGSPWTVGGSTFPPLRPGADPAHYRRQFNAWSEYGLTPLAGSATPYAYSGKQAPVAAFDTSPFTGIVSGRSDWRVVWDAIGMNVPISVTQVPILSRPPITGPMVLASHGTFVLGLAHTVAPNADLYLYRVLDDDGAGIESTVIDGVSRFVRSAGGSGVINLSFSAVITELGAITPTTAFTPLVTISGLLYWVAHGLNHVVVASAGNDSAGLGAQAMRYPAVYDYVIGVAATNSKGDRSCFSNRGDVAAPGGEGEGSCDPPADYTCTFEPYCLLTSWDPTSPTDYAYSAGTSFAAGFVSGLGAYVIEKQSRTGPISSTLVANEIYSTSINPRAEITFGTIHLPPPILPRSFLPRVSR